MDWERVSGLSKAAAPSPSWAGRVVGEAAAAMMRAGVGRGLMSGFFSGEDDRDGGKVRAWRNA